MGVFTWKSSVRVGQSDRKRDTIREDDFVYLLDPHGEESVSGHYDGYGRIGDVDAHVWLARTNLPESLIASMEDEEDVRMAGIMLEDGTVFHDTATGEMWAQPYEFALLQDRDIRQAPMRWDEPMDDFDGQTLIDLVQSGRLEKRSMAEELPIHYPLKITFEANVSYSDMTPVAPEPDNLKAIEPRRRARTHTPSPMD